MIVPKRLLIECTNRCNAKCSYCLRPYMDRRIFDLPFEDFKKWVRSAPYAEWVQPQGIGEPLIYPWIVDAISFIKAQGKKAMFYTNASLLTTGMSARLLDAGLDEITYSVDGFDEYTFGTREGLKWKTVLRNTEEFKRLRDRGGYHTRIKVRATITKRNRFRVFQFFKFWRKRVDVPGMMPEVSFPKPSELDRTPYATGKGFRCYHIFDPGPRPLTPVITILNNGNVVVCCQDWFSDYIMANLYETPILEAFNNPAFNRIREGMSTGLIYPYLCEFCRLGKLGKTHRIKPTTILMKISRKINLIAS